MDTVESQTERRSFPSTHWSQIYLAGDRERDEGARALGELIQTYRLPLQAHLRCRFTATPEQTSEWLDAFVEQRILEMDLLRHANQAGGRFRGFLITCLDRFVLDLVRHENRQRRHPAGGLVALSGIGEHHLPHTGGDHVDPGDQWWAVRVIDQAKDRTEAFYRAKGKLSTWELFCHGCYLPLRYGTARPTDAVLASRFGLPSPNHVASAITTVKRKFGNCVRDVVAKYVPATADVDEEIRELMAILSQGGLG